MLLKEKCTNSISWNVRCDVEKVGKQVLECKLLKGKEKAEFVANRKSVWEHLKQKNAGVFTGLFGRVQP